MHNIVQIASQQFNSHELVAMKKAMPLLQQNEYLPVCYWCEIGAKAAAAILRHIPYVAAIQIIYFFIVFTEYAIRRNHAPTLTPPPTKIPALLKNLDCMLPQHLWTIPLNHTKPTKCIAFNWLFSVNQKRRLLKVRDRKTIHLS